MKTLIVAAIRCSLLFLVPTVTYADSAQWDLDPVSGDWNTAANWAPMTVPNGPSDTAKLALSNTTDVSISANTEVNGITFTAAATNPYTITASPGLTLTISGVGITNNSGTSHNFVIAVDGAGNHGRIVISNSAIVGGSVIFINNGAALTAARSGGTTEFFNTSTAANASFTNNGGTAFVAAGGSTLFYGTSTAAHGIFANNGGNVQRLRRLHAVLRCLDRSQWHLYQQGRHDHPR
jgi:hypothetical protein